MMAVKIIKQPDVHVTEAEYLRYAQEYQVAMMYRVAPYPSLEEFIRQKMAPTHYTAA